MTSPELSRQALAHFERWIEASPEDRPHLLAHLERDRPELAAAVVELVRADAASGLDPDAGPAVRSATLDLRERDRLGPYRLVRILGEGGMGTVWEAQRVENDFEQTVAIKVLRHVVPGSNAERRFLVERELLGKLKHPAIAGILDAGRTASGVPYLVMERVEGEPVDAYCDRRALSIRDRVRLVLGICGAVAHAHRNLIVHRDLKPANILVTADGQPRLLDFGIAKLLDPDLERTALTSEGLGPMTLDYASPEQIQGLAVTTASDVYSLGVVFYRLLTGKTPFGGSTRSPIDLGRAVLENEIRPPSATWSRVTDAYSDTDRQALLEARGFAAPAQLRKALRGDLDNIALRALERDPERRYRTIDAFAADLESWLAGFPVAARGDSPLYRAGKFIRRNWLPVAAGAAVLVSSTVGLGLAGWKAGEAREQRVRADDHARRTELVNRFLVDLLAAPGGRAWRNMDHMGPDTRVIDVLDEAASRLETELADAPLQRATLHQTLNDTYLALGLPDRAEPQVRSALAIRRRELGPTHPRVAESMYYLGATLRSQGRFDQALATYGAALTIERGLPRPTNNYPHAASEAARTASRLGLHRDAESLLREAIEADRAVGSDLDGYLQLLETSRLTQAGDLSAAEATWQAWLRRTGSPDDHGRWAGVTVAWLLGDLDRAERLSADPANTTTALGRAQVLYDLGRWDEASRLLDALDGPTPRAYGGPVLQSRLALAIDGDADRCSALAEPALAAEEEHNRGPTWYLAEARSAAAACRLAHGSVASAGELAESARAILDDLFDRRTPLHDRLPEVPKLDSEAPATETER